MGLGGRAHHDALPPAKAVRLQLLGSYQRPEGWAHRGRVRPEATTGLRRLGAASNLSWEARRRLGCTSQSLHLFPPRENRNRRTHRGRYEKTLLRGLVLRWSGENGRSTLKRGWHPRPRPMATAVVRGEQVGLPPAGSAPATGHMSLYYSTTADSGRDQASDFIRDWHMSKLHVKPFTNSNA